MSGRRRSAVWSRLAATSALVLGSLLAPVVSATAATAGPGATGVAALGANVLVFTPQIPQRQIQQEVDAVAARQVSDQFGTGRYALLFAPGTYGSAADPLVFQVGYYTQVAGLGTSPSDVVINGSVDVYNQCLGTGGTNCLALDNFWRSISNLTINVTGGSGCRANTEFWAVSQAAPMRRVQVNGQVSLMDYCTGGPQYASGGFIADSAFTGGTVINGSQQQFLVRNSNLDGWSNGVWNQVFSGDVGAPAQSFSGTSGLPGGTAPYTTLPASPVTLEPPFLAIGPHGRYHVVVPAPRRDSVGPGWDSARSASSVIALDRFFVARPGDPVGRINAALASGRDLILTPGIYHLPRSLRIRRPNTVVLGLGLATLVPDRGTPAIEADATSGVSISGLILQAGPRNSTALLRFGSCTAGPRPVGWPAGSCDGRTEGSHRTPTVRPGLIADVYFRIGGAAPGRATTSLVVDGSNVILDDIWAWRADHGAGVGWGENIARTGIVVRGNDVTAYGLFVEHYQGDQVVWDGQRGTEIFFQNEMPYDPPSQAAWRSGPRADGHPALRVGANVTAFQGYGLGSYCYFALGVPIHATSAFVVPDRPGVHLHDVLTRFLNGAGGIDHVVNSTGGAVTAAEPGPSDVVSYPAA